VRYGLAGNSSWLKAFDLRSNACGTPSPHENNWLQAGLAGAEWVSLRAAAPSVSVSSISTTACGTSRMSATTDGGDQYPFKAGPLHYFRKTRMSSCVADQAMRNRDSQSHRADSSTARSAFAVARWHPSRQPADCTVLRRSDGPFMIRSIGPGGRRRRLVGHDRSIGNRNPLPDQHRNSVELECQCYWRGVAGNWRNLLLQGG
jgi:hypothetical protein